VNRKPTKRQIALVVILSFFAGMIGSAVRANATTIPVNTTEATTTVDLGNPEPDTSGTDETTDPSSDSTDVTTTTTAPADTNSPSCPKGSIAVNHPESGQNPEFCVWVDTNMVYGIRADGQTDPDTFISNVTSGQKSDPLNASKVHVGFACGEKVVINDPDYFDGPEHILWSYTADACPPPARVATPTATVVTDCVYNADTTFSFYNVTETFTTGTGTITYNPEMLNRSFAPNTTVTWTLHWNDPNYGDQSQTGGTFVTGNGCAPAPTPVKATPIESFDCHTITVVGYDGASIQADVTTELFGDLVGHVTLDNVGNNTWAKQIMIGNGITHIVFTYADGTTTTVDSGNMSCLTAAQEKIVTATV
jgi:hypothetical protein